MAYTGISCNDQHEIIVNPCSEMCLYFPSVSALRAMFVYLVLSVITNTCISVKFTLSVHLTKGL